MRLSCPSCQTEYDVPDAALSGRSRTLRCTNCMAEWKLPALEAIRSEPELAAQVEPAPAPYAPTTKPENFAGSGPVWDAPPDQGEVPVIEADDQAPTVEEVMTVETVEITEATQMEELKPGVWQPERVSLAKASRVVQVPAAPEPPSKRGLKISVLLALLIIVAVLAAHRPIGNFWPPSLRLFNALGLR